MNPNLLPTPKFIPNDVVIYYAKLGNTNRAPIISSVIGAEFDEEKQQWRYHLAEPKWAILESEIEHYASGIFVFKRSN